ncbi:MAG: rod-binding protein [Hyphomicrobiales bacterium]|nr:rod-binding protein [Rickettsiales bacterium]MCP5361296.1 rod-binding protein [Hyphomicrobiales bacterium]
MDSTVQAATYSTVNALQKRAAFLPPEKIAGGGKEAVDAVAKEFESMFISQMVQLMYQGVPVDETFGGGNAETIFRSMLLDEYSEKISNSGGVGIAEHVRAQLLRLQEVSE